MKSASMTRPESCAQCGHEYFAINGNWLRELRLAAGISLREMARRLHFSAAYICDIEHNRRGCRFEIQRAYEQLGKS